MSVTHASGGANGAWCGNSDWPQKTSHTWGKTTCVPCLQAGLKYPSAAVYGWVEMINDQLATLIPRTEDSESSVWDE